MEFIKIPLKAIPNQSLSFSVDSLGIKVEIKVKQLDNMVIMDLIIDDEFIFRGLNCKMWWDMLKPFSHKSKGVSLAFLSKNEKIDKFTYLDFEKDVGLYYVV